MKQITMAEWKKTHRDFKGRLANGTRYILQMTEKGTCPVPVQVIPSPRKGKTDPRAVDIIAPFISSAQAWSLVQGCQGEEGGFFKEKIAELAQTIEAMPESYETDGQGDQAVAHLHYFAGSWDWYIVEKDAGLDGVDQRQAFGLAAGHELEMGYIDIMEITRAGAELDLHWTPRSIGEIKASVGV